MKDTTLLLLHLLVLIGKILRPGGAKSVMAENLMLKQQLIVMGRTRQKAPKLKKCYFPNFYRIKPRFSTNLSS